VKDKEGKVFSGDNVCQNLISDIKLSKILGICISIIAVIVNLILKSKIIGLFETFGPDTRSEQYSQILLGVFVAQFINTALILLFINANLSEHSPQEIT